MRIAVAATPSIAVPTLDWIANSDHDLVLVITRPDRPLGRSKELQESAVARSGRNLGIPIVKPDRSLDLLNDLAGVDLVVTLAYGVILPEAILNVPKYGFLNVHFSLLPAWRGAAPVQRGIENGDSSTGITVFKLDAGMDTGAIYVQEKVSILGDENSGELLRRLSLRAPKLLETSLNMISDGTEPTPQSTVGASIARKIAKSETRINWDDVAPVVERKIRAFSPEPGVWTQWKGMRIQIEKCRLATSSPVLLPGEIFAEGNILKVGCGQETCVEILSLTPAGKRSMSSGEWLNGARCVAGDSFE